MPVPDYQSLMIHALSAAADGEVRIGDVVERLANQLDLTTEERAELLPSGKQTLLANRIHCAKICLDKAGPFAVGFYDGPIHLVRTNRQHTRSRRDCTGSADTSPDTRHYRRKCRLRRLRQRR